MGELCLIYTHIISFHYRGERNKLQACTGDGSRHETGARKLSHNMSEGGRAPVFACHRTIRQHLLLHAKGDHGGLRAVG